MNFSHINRLFKLKIFPLGLIFLLITLYQCQTVNERIDSGSISTIESISEGLNGAHAKQKGAHVFRHHNQTDFRFLTRNNIEWVTLVSWGFQNDYNSQIMQHHNGDSLYILRRDSTWINRIEQVRSAGFKVFLKPHIWIDSPTDGKWRSDIFPANEDNWILWKKSYRGFILRYAKIAQQSQAEMFCIGTELSRLSLEKSDYWIDLIRDVRSIYPGKITYGANWYNEYEHITFWDELDYIGVQAYFPLVDHNCPSVQEISNGWNRYSPSLKSIHNKYNKKILFTEMGYKSTEDSAVKPWEWIEYPANPEKSFSTETQANCYQAFFDSIWRKEWFAGVHIWQLRGDRRQDNDVKENMDFTPLGKTAEQVIAKGFAH